ncbi:MULTISPECIES: aldo/keto reductase [Niallia]|jgi:methylglyoxal/glyoxal reductase|uniref:Aldo/keto reductase n=1 Tax=Niallia circulans TaxID=1397 RepID=A0A268FC89_NIACI|nr:aldo/keto reductase [Niallia circulans]AYV67732.1 aldo/keto reductase [Niallia circulans]AYV73918.1 aldo/keto reductase [Niallia circulans]PAD83000.1 aldo/keto reductase [Niallia circulans]QJX63655.1 aldo/keto reductase [Niallia circulans]
MELSINSTKKLSNGVEIPYLGFGVFLVKDPKECEESVLTAIKNGYRSIDTATRYENEEFVGNAIKAAGVSREELFITTKVWVTDFGYEETKKAFHESLKKLQLDYLDLYLIHWAAPGFEETWRAMEDLYEEGLVRAIGVCNFQIHHLEKLAETARITPMLNQVETHPLFQQVELRNYLAQHNIAHEAWAPLGQGKNGLFNLPALTEIAKKHNKTVAQVILRWHLERDTIIIPKSVHEHRIIENADLFGFALDSEDIKTITSLDTNERSFGNPDDIERFKAMQEAASK